MYFRMECVISFENCFDSKDGRVHKNYGVYERLKIQKALSDQRLVFISHIKHFWENATYDKEHKTINYVVSVNGEDRPIIISCVK
ncbi:hypothetical protein Hanom_Chr08g00724421 [Helianthus anomalus]